MAGRTASWAWLVLLACYLALPGLAKKRVSDSEVQMARAYGYSEKLIEKKLKSGMIKPLAGCSDPKDADFFSRFRTFEEIEGFLLNRICTLRQEIGSEGDLCEVVEIGKSLEDRPIYSLQIRNSEALAKAKAERKREKIVLVTGTLHAREWTSTMTVLLTALRSDITDVSAFFVPVWNPDGYVHAWTGEKSTKKRFAKGQIIEEEVYARMWRKNRRVNDDGSFGVDLNRNFGSTGAIWGTEHVRKSINLTESDVYQGTHGFSEPETKAMFDYHKKYKKNIISFVDIHCCIGAILEPFSTQGKAPEYILDVGQRMIDAINRKAPPEEQYAWRPRPASSASGSGISSSWAYQEAKIPFTYVVELRSKFVMPCTEIKPIANEFILGFRVLLKELSDMEGLMKSYRNGKKKPAVTAVPIEAPLEGMVFQSSPKVSFRAKNSKRGFLYFALGCIALGGVFLVRAKSVQHKES